MDDVLIVEIVESADDLPQDLYCPDLWEGVDLIQAIEQRPTTQILQNQANVVLFLEETIELNDVWMVQHHVELYLPDEPLEHPALLNPMLGNPFDGHYESRLDMLGHENLTELPAPKHPPEEKAPGNPAIVVSTSLGAFMDEDSFVVLAAVEAELL